MLNIQNSPKQCISRCHLHKFKNYNSILCFYYENISVVKIQKHGLKDTYQINQSCGLRGRGEGMQGM